MKSCSLDRQWHHLSADAWRSCKRLRKLYVFYVYPGDSAPGHIHCLTARCPKKPIGEPDPRDPIPDGATIYR